MKILILAALAASAWGQGAVVSQTGDPPPAAEQKLFYYDASNNLQYVCWARQNQMRSTTVQRSDSSLTSVVTANTSDPRSTTVTTSGVHGLYIGARVTISGATVDTDLNGTYTVVTVPSTTTYTISTTNVTINTTFTDATMVITTSYPLTGSTVWAIQVLTYGSGLLTGSYWANAAVGYALACTARTTY